MSQENINSKTEKDLQKFNDLVNGYSEKIVHSFRYLHDIIHAPNCDESVKQKCFNEAVNKVVLYNTYKCAIEFLFCLSWEFHSDAQDHDDYSQSIMSLLKQIMNHSAVVESYKNSRVHYKSYYYVINPARTVGYFFEDETALQILRNAPNRKLFIVFGYHPVVANHVNLQAKWIKYCSKYKRITSFLRNQNLTEEALLSVPVADAVSFISKAMSESYEEFSKNMRHFKTETIRKIVYMYIVAHGKDENAEKILQAIDYIENCC